MPARTRKPRLPARAVPVERVLAALGPLYGPIEWRRRMDPLDELIFTVLTQHTSDLNAGRAFKDMRRLYPSWEDVVGADTGALADAIRSGGLANQKAPRIQLILSTIHEDRGEFDVSFLGRLPLEEARAWLTNLPGVGPKTAAVVLAFSFGMPALPVDTHVHRVATRLGLLRRKTSADQAHEVLEGLVEPDSRFAFHVLVIAHGRRVCRARNPMCSACPLTTECPSSTHTSAGAGP